MRSLSRPLHLAALAGAATALLAMAAVPSHAASFACDKAQTPVERLICATPEVSDLDEYLGRYYAGARADQAHADACLVADQRQWLRGVRNACKDSACLRSAYLQRLAELDPLQPGVTRLKNLALPKTAPLVWVVAPAADQVAAPRNRATRTLSLKGRLANEIASGDGLVLRSADGKAHVVVSTMLLEPPSSDRLAELARELGARYELRGRTDAAGGEGHFSAGHCTYVYRVAP